MALGLLTVVDKTASVGPIFHARVTLVGDGTYPAGGSVGLLAKVRAALGAPAAKIVSVQDVTTPAGSLNRLEYDFATDKLFARVKTTQAESAVADQSAVTYSLLVVVA